MILAILLPALPIGIVIGMFFGGLSGRKRLFAYVLHVLLFIVAGLIFGSNTELYSDEFFISIVLGFTTVVSLGTFLSIDILSVLIRKITSFFKNVSWVKNHAKLLIGLLLFTITTFLIGFYVQDRLVMKKLAGNWYGRNSYDQSLFNYLKVSEDGAFSWRTSSGEESTDVTGQNITFYNDSIAFFQLFVEGAFITRTMAKENDKQFFDAPIIHESSYSAPAHVGIPEEERADFWNNNICAIIGLEKQKIWTQMSFPFSDSEFGEGTLLLNNLDKLFSDELREGLSMLNYHRVEQIKLENGEIQLMVFFLGRRFYGIYTNDKQKDLCFRHFGLLFKKSGTDWLLSSRSILDQCKQVPVLETVTDQKWLNIEPKNISIIRDQMITENVW